MKWINLMKLKLVVSFLMGFSVFILSGTNVQAAYDDLPTSLPVGASTSGWNYDQYISGADETGTAGIYSRQFSFLLYADPANLPSHVNITNTTPGTDLPTCGMLVNGNRAIQSAGRDRSTGGAAGLFEDYGSAVDSACTNEPGRMRLVINPAYFGDSEVFPGKRVTKVIMTVESWAAGYFDVEPSSGSQRVSYVGSTNQDNLSGVTYTLINGSGAGFGNLVVEFSAPCGISAVPRNFYWEDADSSSTQTNNVRLTMRKNGSIVPGFNNISGGDGKQEQNFIAEAGARYRVTFENVRARNHPNGPNTIKVWYPFNSSTYHQVCPPPGGGGGVSSSGCDSLAVGGLSSTRRAYVSVWNFSDGENPQKTQANRLIGNTDGSDSARLITSNQTINFSPREKYVIVDIDYQNDTNGSNSGGWTNDAASNFRATYLCYSASCSVSISPTIGSGLMGGQYFTVDYSITNTNNQDPDGAGPVLAGNWTLPAVFPGTGNQLVINRPEGRQPVGALSSGNTYYYSQSFTAPNNIETVTRTAYADYFGSLAMGTVCSGAADVYRWYDIAPVATAVFDDVENPTRVDWTGGGSSWTANPGVSVRTSFTEQIFRVNENGSANAIATVVNNQTRDFIASLDGASLATNRATFPPGSRVCAQTTLPAGAGWVGPPVVAGVSSNLINTQARSTPGCDNATGPRVVNKPYVQFYGGDVFAGGNFANGIGGVVNGNIKANYRPATRVGSGVEYAMFALGSVNSGVTTGFSSRSLYGDGASQYDTLNFASGSPKGNFGGAHTVNNYFAYKPSSLQQTLNGPSGNPLASGSTTNDYRLGNFTMVGNNPVTGRHAIFIDGDLYIARNVQYANWADINSIPNVAVIVRGNIYIDRDVTQLDGLYSAEPRANGTGGTIYTCSEGFAPGNPTISTCGVTRSGQPNRLVINGAIVAKKVEWLRSIGTLSQGVRGERYNNTQAAEIVRYTPDYLLGTPAYMPSSGQAGGAVDSYRQLPPRL